MFKIRSSIKLWPKPVRVLAEAFVVLGLLYLLLCGVGLLVWSMASRGTEEAYTLVLDSSFKQELRRQFGNTTTFESGFFASRHDGYHGDGQAVHVYKFDPADSEKVCAFLFSKHRTHTWREKTAGFSSVYSVDNLVPNEFLPDEDTELYYGRPMIDFPRQKYFVDRERGLYFSVLTTF